MADERSYLRPGALQRKLNPWVARFGWPALAVKGRRSGEWRVTPLAPIKYEGHKYLVAARGDSDWARNLRASGEGELRSGWKVQPFRAEEIAGAERERVIAAYRSKLGLEVNQYFGKLPDPADHPTFRIMPIAGEKQS